MIIHLFNSPIVSGPERLVLPALADKRDRFMIVNLREDRLEQVRKGDPLRELSQSLGLRYEAIPVKGRWDSEAIRKVRDVIEKEKPELVHAHVVKASVYLAQAKRGLRSAPPMVSTHHGVNALPDLKNRLYEKFYRYYSLRSFDRVLCVMTEDYNTLRRSSARPNDVRLHLNGIDARRVDPAYRDKEGNRIRAQWLPQEKAPERLFLLGVVARLSPEKNHRRLLQVLSHLEKLGPAVDWRCLMFGVGSLDATLREETARLGLDRRVVWMGYRNGVGDELAGFNMLLSFSKGEGLPINLIEAGWAGLPVMSTFIDGVKDLIPDARYGVAVAPDEPAEESSKRLAALLSEKGHATLAKMGEALQARVAAEFSRARWMDRLGEIYAELGISI